MVFRLQSVTTSHRSHLDGHVFVNEQYGYTLKRQIFALQCCVNGALIHNLFDSELFANSFGNVNVFALVLAVKNLNFLTSTLVK